MLSILKRFRWPLVFLGSRKDAAEQARAQRPLVRVLRPALHAVPAQHGGCGRADHAGVPLTLPLDLVLREDPGSYTMVQVRIDNQDHLPDALRVDGRCSVAWLEAQAQRRPQHDWRIIFTEPLQHFVYQRHAPGQWNLVHVGGGYA